MEYVDVLLRGHDGRIIGHNELSIWRMWDVVCSDGTCESNGGDVFHGYWYGEYFVPHKLDGPAILSADLIMFVQHGSCRIMEDLLDDIDRVVWTLKCERDVHQYISGLTGSFYWYIV
jgi:hypothetical protein